MKDTFLLVAFRITEKQETLFFEFSMHVQIEVKCKLQNKIAKIKKITHFN